MQPQLLAALGGEPGSRQRVRDCALIVAARIDWSWMLWRGHCMIAFRFYRAWLLLSPHTATTDISDNFLYGSVNFYNADYFVFRIQQPALRSQALNVSGYFARLARQVPHFKI